MPKNAKITSYFLSKEAKKKHRKTALVHVCHIICDIVEQGTNSIGQVDKQQIHGGDF
jgi:hypothetical protein